MVEEFRVIPIPAYNMQSKLVHPTQYCRTLKDAVVIIRFTLKHWAIYSKSCDANIADIVNMRVLVPPKPWKTIKSTPKKNRIHRSFRFRIVQIPDQEISYWRYLDIYLDIVLERDLKFP